MALKLEMVVRRAVVVLAVLLAVGMGWLLHARTQASERSRGATFFEDASAIRGAFHKALGPHPPVLELVVERDHCTALVVVGATATQHFTLGQENGYVTRGPEGEALARDDIAFSMSAVPFDQVPGVVTTGGQKLGAAVERLVIDREPGAPSLRYRVFASDGRVEVVKIPDP